MKKVFKTAAFLLAMGLMTSTFTSCGEDDGTEDGPAVDEVIETGNFKIKANANGTVTFVGDVASNAKIKTFQLQDANGAVKYDFLESNDVVKEKNKVIDENGKVTKEKVFNLKDINSGELPVAIYKLVIKTKAAKTDATIGREFNLTIGTSANDNIGSYVSLSTAKVYSLGQLTDYVKGSQSATKITDEEAVKTIELVYKDGGAFESATEIGNKVVKGAITQKAAIYSASKTVMTSTGCIATYNFQENSSSNTAELTGIIIDSQTIAVDVTNADWTKTKGSK